MGEAEETYCKVCVRIRWVGVILAIFVAVAFLDFYYDLHNYILNMVTGKYDVYGQATIVDGDSIKINGESIRLMHIDAPEKKQYCIIGKHTRWACGVSSEFALKEIIGEYGVGCKRIKKGFYGRTLAVCYNHDGIDINAYMVDIGMAIPYRKDKTYSKLAENAKENKRGIWDSDFDTPWDYRKNKRTNKHKNH